MRKSVEYSQNYLVNKKLIVDLVEKASINRDDYVYEIGPGRGVITEGLIKRAKKVIAYEIDDELFGKLSRKYQSVEAIDVRLGDFLKANLPSERYKLFSNIPFNLTSEIIRKLTQGANSPVDIYIIVQSEAAKRFVGKPFARTNSLWSAILYPWYEVRIFHEFRKNDFFPRPRVDVVMLNIKLRERPVVSYKNIAIYKYFVAYAFSQTKPNIIDGLSGLMGKQTMVDLAKRHGFLKKLKPSELDMNCWVEIFKYYLENTHSDQKNIIKGFYIKQQKLEEKISKIRRTRKDPRWKKFH